METMLRVPRPIALVFLLLALVAGGVIGSLTTGHIRQSSFPTSLTAATTTAVEPSFENGFAPIAEAALAAVVNIQEVNRNTSVSRSSRKPSVMAGTSL